MKFKIIIISVILLLSIHLFAQQSQKRPTVGLVLSGGGAKGIAHIGVLKVLEREGIKVDYITGTSMGSLVGGLYSIGYSAEELERIILSQNWDNLLSDKIDRKYKSIENRKFDDRYLVSFPLEIKTGISLPKGAVSGQKVSNLLTELTIPVHDINDFSKFPIPFKCIATDLETGDAVVLKTGSLAESMRASMSIPTVYTPVQIGDRLLIDGGLVRNLPVSDIKEFKPDIIISVDVNNMLLKSKNLKDITTISEQTITIMMLKENKRQRKMSDLVIDPDMTGMTTASFLKAEELVKRGEDAALSKLDEIKKLIGKSYPDLINQNLKADNLETHIKIDKVKIVGLKNQTEKYIMKKLNLKINDPVEYNDIKGAITRIYGTGSFERVTYRIEKNKDNETVLVVNTIEKNINSFNVGLRYDTEQNAALLLNLTLKNWVLKDSISIFEAKVGDNPKYTVSYLTPIGFLYYFAIEENYWHNEFDLHIYEDDEKVTAYRCNVNTGNINLQSFIFYNFVFGIGAEFEHVMLDVDISKVPQEKDVTHSYFLNYYFFYKFDSMNEKYFPTSGLKIYGEYRSISLINENDKFIDHNSAYIIKFEVETAYSLNKYISIHNNFTSGAVRGRYVPQQYYFFIGGLSDIEGRVYPFYGLKYMEKYGNYFQMYEGALQFNIFKYFYLSPRLNAVRIQYDVDQIQDDNYKEIIYGYAASVGAKTPIGPIEGSISTNQKLENVNFSFYFGYQFN